MRRSLSIVITWNQQYINCFDTSPTRNCEIMFLRTLSNKQMQPFEIVGYFDYELVQFSSFKQGKQDVYQALEKLGEILRQSATPCHMF